MRKPTVKGWLYLVSCLFVGAMGMILIGIYRETTKLSVCSNEMKSIMAFLCMPNVHFWQAFLITVVAFIAGLLVGVFRRFKKP